MNDERFNSNGNPWAVELLKMRAEQSTCDKKSVHVVINCSIECAMRNTMLARRLGKGGTVKMSLVV